MLFLHKHFLTINCVFSHLDSIAAYLYNKSAIDGKIKTSCKIRGGYRYDKKIENGDVKQVAGGQIVEVVTFNTTDKKAKNTARDGARFLVVDPNQNGKIMVHRSLTAEEAIEAEEALFGSKANTKQYKALTGKMVDF